MLEVALRFVWLVFVNSGVGGIVLQAAQQLSHRPPRIALLLQPLVVTVINLLPNNQVMHWPSFSKNSAAKVLKMTTNKLYFLSKLRCKLRGFL